MKNVSSFPKIGMASNTNMENKLENIRNIISIIEK